MPLSPVAARELLVQARRRSTYGIRLTASIVAGFLMLWVLVVAGAPIPTAGQGKALFSILSTLAFLYCLFVGPLMTADCLSSEKRDGTLGLILLTDLKGYDVVLGKLASSSIHAVYGLIAVLPMLSMALLFGGISAPQITQMVLVLGNTLFFSLAAGMFVSTISKHDRKAFFGAVLLVLIVSAVPYELGFLIALRTGTGGAPETWPAILLPSPVFAFTLTQAGTAAVGPVSALTLWSSLAVTHSIAWGLLLISCLIVPHLGRERPKGKRRERWTEWWRELTLGVREKRARLRTRLLDQNACLWLSSRERYKPALPWVLVFPLGVLGFWISIRYPTVFIESGLFLIFALQILLKVWFTAETCGRWIEDRRNGALELLLCAPLKTNMILRGQELALRRQFGLSIAAIVVLTILGSIECIRITGNLFGDNTWMLLLCSVPVFLADLATLRWVGTWFGLTARGLNRAMSATLSRVLVLRWIIFALFIGATAGMSWIAQGQISSTWQTVLWPLLALVSDWVLLRSARRKFLHFFRIIASNPADFRASPVPTAVKATTRESRHVKGRSMRTRPRLVYIGLVLSLLVGAYFGYRRWLERGIEIRLQAVRKAGFPVTFAEMERARPTVAKEVNAALLLEEASRFFTPTWRIPVPRSIRPSWSAWTGSSGNGGSIPKHQDIAPLQMLISSNQAALDMLHAAPSLRLGRYAADWSSPSYNSQAQGFNGAAEILQAEVFLRIENGDARGALESLHRLLDLARSLDNEEAAYMFGHLRTACLKRVFVTTQYLISRCSLPLSDLENLQKEFEDLEAHINLGAVLAGLRCSIIDNMRRPPDLFTSGMRMGLSPIEQIRREVYVRMRELTGAADRDLIAFLDMMEEFVLIAPIPYQERIIHARQIAAKQPRANQNGGPGFSVSAKLVLDSFIVPQIELEAKCRAARTSMAIERFRLRHGAKLPENLGDLAPEFISNVPLDPFDGRPMRFQRQSRGYSVYSVGRNGRDDGGAQRGSAQSGKWGERSDDLSFVVD